MAMQDQDPIVPVTRDIVRALKAHHRRTGVSALALLKKQSYVPDGLSASDILSWVSAYNRLSKAPQSHIDYVLGCWAQEPNTAQRGSNKPQRVKITPEIIDKIKAEQERTGVGTTSLFRIHTDGFPKDINALLVRKWIGGASKSARVDYLASVMELWAALPDRQECKPATYEDIRYGSYKPISEEDLEKLRYYRDRYGLLPSKLLKDCQDTPNGLDVTMISSWLGGQTKKADPELIGWVLKRCREKEKLKLV